jgi:hypothetical protein
VVQLTECRRADSPVERAQLEAESNGRTHGLGNKKDPSRLRSAVDSHARRWIERSFSAATLGSYVSTEVLRGKDRLCKVTISTEW